MSCMPPLARHAGVLKRVNERLVNDGVTAELVRLGAGLEERSLRKC
jgi:hypothetical protein